MPLSMAPYPIRLGSVRDTPAPTRYLYDMSCNRASFALPSWPAIPCSLQCKLLFVKHLTLIQTSHITSYVEPRLACKI